MQKLSDKLVETLKEDKNIKFYLDEPVKSLEFDKNKSEKPILIDSKTRREEVDLLISSIFSKSNLKKLKICLSNCFFYLFFLNK
jgi:hypothetical protein